MAEAAARIRSCAKRSRSTEKSRPGGVTPLRFASGDDVDRKGRVPRRAVCGPSARHRLPQGTVTHHVPEAIVFASETVDVILDRRAEERRRFPLRERRAVERRREDRRQRDITKDLQTYGWAVGRR